MRGALVGELFANILADGFSRLQRGDRYWFENNQFTSSKFILLLHAWINSIEQFFLHVCLVVVCSLDCLFIRRFGEATPNLATYVLNSNNRWLNFLRTWSNSYRNLQVSLW